MSFYKLLISSDVYLGEIINGRYRETVAGILKPASEASDPDDSEKQIEVNG